MLPTKEASKMRSLLKLLLIGCAVLLVALYHTEITQRVSRVWNDASGATGPSPVTESLRDAGSAANSLMKNVGNAIGR
jgi:hypothetical protein